MSIIKTQRTAMVVSALPGASATSAAAAIVGVGPNADLGAAPLLIELGDGEASATFPESCKTHGIIRQRPARGLDRRHGDRQ